MVSDSRVVFSSVYVTNDENTVESGQDGCLKLDLICNVLSV